MSLLDGLENYYQLDEASGSALDAHGSRDLTDNNTVGAGTGRINGGRDFELSNGEYFSLADASAFSFQGDWSISCWINAESIPSTVTIASKFLNAGNQRSCRLIVLSSGSAQLRVTGDGVNESVATGGTTITTGTFFHLVAIHDSVADQIAIIVNDGTPGTAAHAAGVFDSTADFVIGAIHSASSPFDGIIDEFGLWSRVLTAEEIGDLYNSGNGLSYDNFSGGGFQPWFYRDDAQRDIVRQG